MKKSREDLSTPKPSDFDITFLKKTVQENIPFFILVSEIIYKTRVIEENWENKKMKIILNSLHLPSPWFSKIVIIIFNNLQFDFFEPKFGDFFLSGLVLLFHSLVSLDQLDPLLFQYLPDLHKLFIRTVIDNIEASFDFLIWLEDSSRFMHLHQI